MAVTVKLDDKKKKAAPGKPVVAKAGFTDYVLPREKKEGWKALGIWLAIMAFFCVPVTMFSVTQSIGIGLIAWWVLSSTVYLFLWPMFTVRRLRVKGPEALISDKTQPRIKSLLKKAGSLIGVREPDGFLEAEGAPRVIAMPRALIVRQGALELLEPDEVNCLAVRCLVHIRLGQARRMAFLRLVEDTLPLYRFFIWPVLIYSKLLMNFWHLPAQENADRLSLLLIKNKKLLISAIVKEKAANDPNMQLLEVSTADVTNWVLQAGHIGMAGEEISIQYKLGRAIHEDPPFETRIFSLQKWAESPQYSTALEKLGEAVRRSA